MRHAVPVCVLLCVFGCSKKPDETGGGNGSATSEKKTEPPKKDGTERVEAPAGKVVRGDVEIGVFAAALYNTETIAVTVTVKNNNKDRLVEFGGWEGTGTVTDDKGNTYKPMRFDPVTESAIRDRFELKKKNSYGRGSVYHEMPRAQLLAFARPVASAEYLDLDLDGSAVGSREPIRFRIPRAMWKKD